MKIYQVEELVGITRKNIRFYEDEGLLNPERNPENGYREYSLKDVRQLEKIKLLRKLDVPIEEIRLLQHEKMTFCEAMNHQVEALEQKQKDALIMIDFCRKMKEEISDINQLDASTYLSEMEKMETEGTKFVDIEKEDINRKKKSGSIASALVFCAFLMAILVPVTIAMGQNKTDRIIGIVLIVIAAITVIGIIIMLIQRIKEINNGEEYEARKY